MYWLGKYFRLLVGSLVRRIGMNEGECERVKAKSWNAESMPRGSAWFDSREGVHSHLVLDLLRGLLQSVIQLLMHKCCVV